MESVRHGSSSTDRENVVPASLEDGVKKILESGVVHAAHQIPDYIIHVRSKKGTGFFDRTITYSKALANPDKCSDGSIDRQYFKGKVKLLTKTPEDKTGYVYACLIDSLEGRAHYGYLKVSDLAGKSIPRPVAGDEDHDNFIMQAHASMPDCPVDFSNVLELMDADNVALQGTKLTSFTGVVVGSMGMEQAFNAYKEAKRKGDKEGMRLAVFAFVKNLTYTSLGAVAGTGRIVALTTVGSTVKTVAVAKEALGLTATSLCSLFYTFLGVGAIHTLSKVISLDNALDKAVKEGGEEKAYLVLRDRMTLSNEEIEAACEKKLAKREALLGKMTFLTKEERALLTAEDKARIRDFVESHKGTSTPEEQTNLFGHIAKKLALKKGLKRANLEKLIGKEAYTLLQEKVDLGKAHEMGPILASIHQSLRSKKILQTIILITVILGIISFIMASIFTAGAPLIAALIVMLVSNLMMTGLDIKDFIDLARNTSSLSAKDKILLGLLFVITTVSTIVGALFAPHLIMRISIIVMGILMAGVQVGTVAYITKKASHKENTLQEEPHAQ